MCGYICNISNVCMHYTIVLVCRNVCAYLN